MCHLFEDRGLTPGQIGLKLGLTSNQVAGQLYHMEVRRGDSRRVELVDIRREQLVEMTHERLKWAHGSQVAWSIRNGHDDATNADLAAWNQLGRRSAA